MFLQDTLDAVISYLSAAKTAGSLPTVKTIDVYKGQLSAALKNKSIIKFADPLPAIYAVLIDALPLAFNATRNVDLLVISESKTFNKSEKQTAAITAADALINLIDINNGWQYNGKHYSIDAENLKITTLMTDDSYTILTLTLTLHNTK